MPEAQRGALLLLVLGWLCITACAVLLYHVEHTHGVSWRLW